MDEPSDPVTPARLRVMRIIVFAQIMGLLVFAGAVAYIVQSHKPAGRTGTMFSIMALALTAAGATASLAFPRFVQLQQLRRIARGEWRPPPRVAESAYATDAAKLFAVYLSTMIMGLALVEGAGFCCCIAYLLEGQPYVLALLAIALVLQIGRFPTESGVRGWMERQLDFLEQERRRMQTPG
ncbi:MAG TPA: hypothetical protein VMS17_33950 [Gemmataceae bacterium]|nr:hypothetical protein [Gemmataceae bacterium]